MRTALLLSFALAGLLGCGATVQGTTGDAGPRPDAGTATDAGGTATDVGTRPDTGTATDAGDTATDAGGTPTDAGGTVVTDASVVPADVPFTGPCRAGDLCLVPRTPVAGLAVTSGRLAVVWFQLNDDGPDPAPQVAVDVPFDGSSSMVRVPYAAIAPPRDAVLYCARACSDEAACPCAGGPRLGFAYVLVAQDADANGRLDFGPRTGGRADPVVAVGYVIVVQSPEAMAVASAPLDMLFTAGIARGVAPYLPIRRGTRDVLGAPEPTRVYDLNFCPPDNPACAPYLPDLE